MSLLIVDVKSLTLSATDSDGTAISFTNNTQYIFTEGESREFTCQVNGAYPLPEVQVFLAGNDITESFDKTEDLMEKGTTLGMKELTYKYVEPGRRRFRARVCLYVLSKLSVCMFQCGTCEPRTNYRLQFR